MSSRFTKKYDFLPPSRKNQMCGVRAADAVLTEYTANEADRILLQMISFPFGAFFDN